MVEKIRYDINEVKLKYEIGEMAEEETDMMKIMKNSCEMPWK